MLCSNRTSSCDFLAERRREQEGYQNSGSFGEKSWGYFADVNQLSFAREAIVAKHGHALPYRMAMTAGLNFLPAPSPRLQHFVTPFPMAKHRVPARATDRLVRRSRSSCHLLALKHPLRS